MEVPRASTIHDGVKRLEMNSYSSGLKGCYLLLDIGTPFMLQRPKEVLKIIACAQLGPRKTSCDREEAGRNDARLHPQYQPPSSGSPAQKH